MDLGFIIVRSERKSASKKMHPVRTVSHVPGRVSESVAPQALLAKVLYVRPLTDHLNYEDSMCTNWRRSLVTKCWTASVNSKLPGSVTKTPHGSPLTTSTHPRSLCMPRPMVSRITNSSANIYRILTFRTTKIRAPNSHTCIVPTRVRNTPQLAYGVALALKCALNGRRRHHRRLLPRQSPLTIFPFQVMLTCPRCLALVVEDREHQEKAASSDRMASDGWHRMASDGKPARNVLYVQTMLPR